MSASSPIEIVDGASSSTNAIDHCTVLEVLNHGQKHFKCLYCAATFKGTGTRCYVHLTGDGKGVAACQAVPNAVITSLKAAQAKKAADRIRREQAAAASEQSKRQGGPAWPPHCPKGTAQQPDAVPARWQHTTY
jgi:hypothetical protein